MPSLSRRAFLASVPAAALAAPPPFGAVPSARQLAWHAMEMNAFLHFTVNTFTDKEWGYGDEDPSIFNPTAFDADAIVRALKDGGMRGVILTCKHHDGFCLWPTKTTAHHVQKGDIVRSISEAAHRQGLQFGVYLSPWDRNTALYARPEYIDLYRAQLRELLTQYGPIFEVWHDGANGGDGFYGGAREKRTIDKRTYYDWPNTWHLVRDLQPGAVIFSDVGPDIRWVGNERGFAAETSWATYDPRTTDGGPAAPGLVNEKELPGGTRKGARWLPAECDVSIRPGWFFHEKENARVKTPRQLMDLYYRSVGRGANLLLNVPPDRRGLLHENDVASLRGFGSMVHNTFAKNLATGPKEFHHDTEFKLKGARTFNVVRVREEIRLGQRVAGIEVDAFADGAWKTLAKATSIGNCRLIRLESDVTAERVRLRITSTDAPPQLKDFGLFLEKA